MRKAFTALLAVAAVLAGILGFASPASALTTVDFGTTVAASPSTQVTAGELVHYFVSYSRSADSLVDASLVGAKINDSIDFGSIVSVTGAPAGCGAATSTVAVDCIIPLAAGETVTIQVTVDTTGVTAPSIVNTSTITTDPAIASVLDVAPENNVATSTVAVVQPSSPTTLSSSGFLRPNTTDRLVWKTHVMTALRADGAAGGISATMSDAVITPGTTCDGRTCSQDALHFDFDQDPAYKGRAQIEYNPTDQTACFGIGSGKCHTLYFRKTAADPFQVLPDCTSATDAICLRSFVKVNNVFRYFVESETNDPDLTSLVGSFKG